ncbi:hypothetical protein JL39_21890 [Rhizobium sp. YS-1r]|jgi:hypothetical protein|nr:hypothetical protein JL39_21890 [Rhizobium sp. YS-1r]
MPAETVSPKSVPNQSFQPDQILGTPNKSVAEELVVTEAFILILSTAKNTGSMFYILKTMLLPTSEARVAYR